MSAQLLYTVTLRFVHEVTAAAWRTWLLDEHFEDLLGAGAERAELAAPDACTLHCFYLFESAAQFAIYERDHAPRLRAYGLARVAAGDLVTFERSTAPLYAAPPRV